VFDELIPGFWLFAAVIALLPGLSHWWGSRPLRRSLDDPLLPERVFALQRRTAASYVGAMVILTATARSALLWAIPLLVLTRVLAAYPLRRALYEETWSVPQYLVFTTRTMIALVGFWFLMATMPMLASLAGGLDWLVALALGVLLLVWSSFYASAVLTLFNAQPLRDEALLARLIPMAQQCGLDDVRFAVADLKGGAIVNALALASLRMRGVLFTDGLLARLTLDETVAIGAHEIAHLEYYNPHRLRRGRLLIWSLVPIGAALAPISRMTGSSLLLIEAVWVMTLVGVLVGLAHHRQKNETDSDRRAVELTGDGEALARGLTKAYAFNKYPRRLAAQVEQRQTHPSLARRLRDIRAAAATSPVALSEAVAFTTEDGTRVRLEPERLVWEEAAGGMHAFPYSQLTELRIDAERRAGPRLVAVDRTARQWTFGLSAADTRAVQTALDTVDGLLTQSQTSTDRWAVVAQIVASLAVIAAMAAGSIVASLIALAAACRGGRVLFAAAGAASLAALLVGARQGPGVYSVPAMVFLVPAAAVLLTLALRTAPKPLARTDKGVLAAIAAATLLSLTTVASDGIDPVSMFLITRSTGSVIVLTWALAAALTFLPKSPLRRVGPVVGAIAIAVALSGTQWFVTTFGNDGLLVEGRPFDVKNIDAVPDHEFTSPLEVSELRLSPGGRAVALAVYDVDAGGEATGRAFHVGRTAGSLIRVPGHDLAFFDDHSYLVMRSAAGNVALAAHGLDASEASWRAEIEGLYPTRLVVDGANRRWILLGTDEADRIVRVEGSADGPAFTRREWNPTRSVAYPTVIASSGDGVLVVESDYDFGDLATGPLATFAVLRGVFRATNGVRWWSTSGREADLGRSKFSAECVGDTYNESAIQCMAFDGASTRFASIDPANGSVVPAGTLPGQFIGYQSAAHGWVTGYSSSRVLIADVAHARAFGFDRGRWSCEPTVVAASEQYIAAAWTTGRSATIRLFRLPATAPFR
jgi:Zn-dependent protease with chaperone function